MSDETPSDESTDLLSDAEMNRMMCTELMRALILHAEVHSLVADLESAQEQDLRMPFMDIEDMLELFQETLVVYESSMREAAIHLELEFDRKDVNDLAHEIFMDDTLEGERAKQIERMSTRLYQGLENEEQVPAADGDSDAET